VFLHHPLILKKGGEKLSKASSDAGIAELRRAGVRPAEVIGRAAAAVGIVPAHVRLPAERVVELFT
jgi:hypothetical protein